MKDRKNKTDMKEEDRTRGIVVVPNIQGFSQQYNKIIRKHK